MILIFSSLSGIKSGPPGLRQLRTIFPNAGIKFLWGKLDQLRFYLSKRSTFTTIERIDDTPVIKVFYPAERFGPLPGTQWKAVFESVETAFMEYKVFIPPDFDFVKGGKLPGLGGGQGNTGGKVPNGRDGWSVRFMFKEGGRLCVYSYTPDMTGKYGEKRFLMTGDQDFVLPRGRWVKIGLQLKMNELGKNDGTIKCFVNDDLCLNAEEIIFRTSSKLKIDHLLFSTFFGGADSSYAPSKDCYLLFKDFKVEDLI